VLQVRQPLINLDGIARYRQGKAQTKYASAQFDSQQQEVIVRLVSAYLDVLYKQDLLGLAEVQRDTYIEQRKVNDMLFKKGEGTSTDMLETQARLDQAEAAVLEAQDNLTNSRDTLGAIIGGDVGTLDPLSPEFRVRPADQVSFEAWKNIALERNPDIKTLEAGLEVAKAEVLKSRAGHAPRVDFVGSYSKSSSDSIQSIGQDSTVRSIGVQINIPLYSGGAVNATTRQSVASQEKAREDLQAQKDKIIVELHKDYDSLMSSGARIDALLKSVASSELLIKATEKSVIGGVRINLDVLNAKQQLFTSKRDLAQARYNYLINTLRMRASIGTLSANDVQEMAPYFRTY
jgi:protease secretion system outer membrane protein